MKKEINESTLRTILDIFENMDPDHPSFPEETWEIITEIKEIIKPEEKTDK